MGNTIDYYKTATSLLGNALKFRYARLLAAPLKPRVVSLSVTNRCNSRCIMCNMWRQARERPGIRDLELSGNEIVNLLSQPLFSHLVELDVTGGEPHLRDDLVDTILRLADLRESYLPRLRTIVVTSNGLLPERVIAGTQKILEGIWDTDIDLVSVASIDGIGNTHDTIRGTKGAFEKAIRTIDGLLELKQQFPGYFIGLKTTVLPQNIAGLDGILDFALEKGLFHIISPAFFTETRFRNTASREALALQPADYATLLNFYNRRELDTNYFYSRIREFLSAGRKCWSCTAAYNYMFIEFDGTVYPCELLSEPVGNVREASLDEIWHGVQARHWRKRIDKTEKCRECLEPGAVRYSAFTEGLAYLGFLRDLGRPRFAASLYGEGFHKYFNG